MPSLKQFSDATGLPRQRRWGHVYGQVRDAVASGQQPPPIAAVRAAAVTVTAQSVVRALKGSPLRRLQPVLLDADYTALPRVDERLSGHEAYKAENGWIMFS